MLGIKVSYTYKRKLIHAPAGFKVKTGRKTWAFEVRQLDKHADLWVKEIQQSINR